MVRRDWLELGLLAFFIESNQLTRNIANILVTDAGIVATRAQLMAKNIVSGLRNRLRGFSYCWFGFLITFLAGVFLEVGLDKSEAAGRLYVLSSVCLGAGLFFVLLLLTFFAVPTRQDLDITHTAWEKTARAFHQLRRNIYLSVYVMLFFALFLSLRTVMPIPVIVLLPSALLLGMLFVLPIVLDRSSNRGPWALLVLAFLMLSSIGASHIWKEAKGMWLDYIYPHIQIQKEEDIKANINATASETQRAVRLDTIRKKTALYDCPYGTSPMPPADDCTKALNTKKEIIDLLPGEEIFIVSGETRLFQTDNVRLVWVRKTDDPSITGFVMEDAVLSLYKKLQDKNKPWWGFGNGEQEPYSRVHFLRVGESVTFSLVDDSPMYSSTNGTVINGFGIWTLSADKATGCWSYSNDGGGTWKDLRTFRQYPIGMKGSMKEGVWLFKANANCVPVTIYLTCNSGCLGGS